VRRKVERVHATHRPRAQVCCCRRRRVLRHDGVGGSAGYSERARSGAGWERRAHAQDPPPRSLTQPQSAHEPSDAAAGPERWRGIDGRRVGTADALGSVSRGDQRAVGLQILRKMQKQVGAVRREVTLKAVVRPFWCRIGHPAPPHSNSHCGHRTCRLGIDAVPSLSQAFDCRSRLANELAVISLQYDDDSSAIGHISPVAADGVRNMSS